MDKRIRNAIGGGQSLGKIIIISPAGNFEDEFFSMPDGSLKILRLELKPTASIGEGLLVQLKKRLDFALEQEDYNAAREYQNQINLLENGAPNDENQTSDKSAR